MQTSQFKINNIEINKMPDSGLYYYTLNSVRTLYNSINKKIFKGQYYPINLNAQYVHFLVDGVGGYFQLKKYYPDLKPIYFINERDMGNPNKKANYEILNILDAEVVDITSTDCSFEQIIMPHSFLSPIPFTDFFMYLKYDIDVVELFNNPKGSDVWYCNSSKIIFNLLNKNNQTLEKNIYVSRSKINKKIINDKLLMPRAHHTLYDDVFDREMKNLGYEVIFSEDYGLMEQIDLFVTAKNLVSISGSSLFNGIWCHDKANIIEIKVLPNYYFYWKDILKSTGKELNTLSYSNNPDMMTINTLIKEIDQLTI